MKYKILIRFDEKEFCKICGDRKEMIHLVRLFERPETIYDIRKIYKSGVSDSVLEKYQNLIERS